MTKRSFVFVFSAWSVIALIHAFSRYMDIVRYKLEVPFGVKEVAMYMLIYALWAFFSLALLSILKRLPYPFRYINLTSLFCLGLFIWVPIYLSIEYSLTTLISGGGLEQLKEQARQTSAGILFFYGVIFSFTFFACLGGVLAEKTRLSIRLNDQLKQQQTALALQISEQQMQLMQSQLSPHFLFNCLSAISGLARTGKRDILIQAVAKVGNLLRFTITNSTTPLITLDEELGFVDDYINLQHLRFDKRFTFASKINIPESCIMCPPFTIQPLVENAFRHAVEHTEQTIAINMLVSYQDNEVTISIENTYPPQQTAGNNNQIHTHTGLKNLKARLTHMYKENVEINVNNNLNSFEVKLVIKQSFS